VYKVTKRSKEVIAFMSVQYIGRTWVKLVLECVPCTVNKHKGKCTAVYSTNRQSKHETSAEPYLMPVNVEKVKGSIPKGKVCRNRMVMVEQCVSYGKKIKVNYRFKVFGRYYRMVIDIRYAKEKVCRNRMVMVERYVNYGMITKVNYRLKVFGCCYRMVIDIRYASYCC
jgi:hypothetical protein